MEVPLGLIILTFALLGIAGYRLSEYRGDVPLRRDCRADNSDAS
jgi:hypothetical protein